MKLKDIAKTIRSKNAGVNNTTFDIIFWKREDYERVKKGQLINEETILSLYRVPKSRLAYFGYFDPAKAIKFTIRREEPSGSPGDSDIYGCQQYPPLFDLEV